MRNSFFKLSLTFFLFFLSCDCFAVTTVVNQNMCLGNFVQLKERARVHLEKNGQLSHLDGFSEDSGSFPLNASLTFAPEPEATSGRVRIIDTNEFLLNGINCTLKVKKVEFSQKDVKDLSTEITVTMGAELEAQGYCTPGEYSGILLLQYETCDTKDCTDGRQSHEVPISITIYLASSLRIEKQQDMSFGTIFTPNTSSTVTVSPSGEYSSTGNVNFKETDIKPGQFEITGIRTRSVSVTIPDSTVLTNENGNTMNVDTFTVSPSSPITLVGQKEQTMGTATIDVGATLYIKAGQESGSYTGIYPVVVSY